MFQNDSDHLDQHFLVDLNVINKFIDSCHLQKSDNIVEVGPGTGTLTKIIVPKVNSLIVIEKDERLKKYLDEIKGIKVIYGDVINIDIPKCNKIITSLPYSIIEPFIYKMTNTNFDELYMIMGSNYVNNVINKKITNLSLLTNVYFDTTKIMDITPDAFNPQPRTMSALIKITPKSKPKSVDIFFRQMYKLDHKKCKNAMIESLILVNKITQKESKAIVNSLNLNDSILNNEFNLINNQDLTIIYQKIFDLFNN